MATGNAGMKTPGEQGYADELSDVTVLGIRITKHQAYLIEVAHQSKEKFTTTLCVPRRKRNESKNQRTCPTSKLH
jgi:hypothetical protein